ncbi:hypothetical protein [Streptomyces chartreusis]|uniref:DUF2637 domain-containing protein n=1 Tax=Streptomyces chartreusis TaxID=1969 RepID=A0A7H8TAZ1_STRCX|nr:hypothetical protein [Streptomyces chartreusis]QKZ20586.1 hypothetical protein HUT05_26530 [Streptomyces chartreusis]
MSGTPAWVLVVTAGAVALALLGTAYLAIRTLWRAAERKRQHRRAELAKAAAEGRQSEVIGLGGMGRQAYVALAGMAVSIYGMWGFATQTAQLPHPIAVGFIAMFDAMELVLFSQLYRRANPKVGWTPELKLIHSTAWALVAVSATANVIHAPNPVSAPFLGLVPIGAAWVIKLELQARMSGSEQVDESKAGPVRLLVLLWTKGWAAAFSGLGLDPKSTSGQVARATLAKKAATRLFKLRKALEQHAKLIQNQKAKRKDLAAAVKELDALRRRATSAMDRSDFALDSAQALAVLRGLAGWTRVDDVATVDTSNTPEVMKLMEEVAILPSAKRIEAAERAAELEEQAERAAEAQAEAEAARERAEEEKRAAVEEKAAAVAAREEAEEALAKAAEETEKAKAEAERAEGARQRAEAARKRAESEMTEESRNVAELARRAEEEQDKLTKAAEELARVQDLIAEESERRTTAAAEVTSIREQLKRLENERASAEDTTRTKTEEARRTEGEVERLRSALVEAQNAVSEHTRAAEQAAELRRQAEENKRLAAKEADRTRAEAQEAAELLESLRPQLAERLGGEAEVATLAEAPAFRSEEKQKGWVEYLAAATEGRELPTAKELAVAYGVSEGNTRNWLIDFKERRAAMIANGGARQADGETARSETRRAASSDARQEPSGYRADGHERADDAAQTRSINGQRQPV